MNSNCRLGPSRAIPCVEQCQRSRPDRTGQRVELANAVEAADVTDSALTVTVGLLDSMAQGAIFGGFAEHDAPPVVLLKGFVDPIACAGQLYCLSLPPLKGVDYPFYKGRYAGCTLWILGRSRVAEPCRSA